MLARGNTDAAVRLRRAKSAPSVTKVRPTPFTLTPDPYSTYTNARTAATKAFQTAHGLISRGQKVAPITSKRRSGGPGSHLALQRSNGHRTEREGGHSFGSPRSQNSKSESNAALFTSDHHSRMPITAPQASKKTKSFLSEGHGGHDIASSACFPPDTPPVTNANDKISLKWETFQSLNNSSTPITTTEDVNACDEASFLSGRFTQIDLKDEHDRIQVPQPVSNSPRPPADQTGVWKKLKVRSKSLSHGLNEL